MSKSYTRVSKLLELLLVVTGVSAPNEESYEAMTGVYAPKAENYEEGYGSFLS